MRVDQVLAAAGPVDAVTGQARAVRRLLESWGWSGEDYAEVIAEGVSRGTVRPLRGLEPDRADAVLVHYSGYCAHLEERLEGARRLVVISHNITPAGWFWSYEALDGVHCTLARPQLAHLARRADVAAGVSEYNAAELRDAGASRVEVIPILFDPSSLPAPAPARPPGPPTVIFVGRLTPHKRQDLVIRAFALYRRRHAPDARLVLVGTPLTPEFAQRLRGLADDLAPGAVTIESGLAPERLWELYGAAHAMLCLSEHEGFCIPLLEAFHFDVPVVAREAGAVPEVLGDAGLLLRADDGLPVAAEALHLAVSDEALRAQLHAAAQARLAAYEPEGVAGRLRAALEAAP